jgi:inositol phosphorylceramide mannosyltransferase catalytic subunit
MKNRNKTYNIILCILFILLLFIIYNMIKKPKLLDHFVNNNRIPKIIIQTWKDNNIPDKYIKDIDSIKKYNPEYKYLFFTDKDIENFLKVNYPNNYYIIYLKLPLIIQKIDFFRYVAIYHFGGIYLDLDITCLGSFDEILKYDAVFPVDHNFDELMCNKYRFKDFCNKGQMFMLGQYAFAAIPKNNFIKLLIDVIEKNINEYINLYPIWGKTLQYTYSTTGPDFVTNIYIDYNKKEDIHILHYDKDQYFGKYAKHNFFGTWKNRKIEK